LHLLALKCHAVRHGHAGRIAKDAEDVIQLIRINRLDPESETVQDCSRNMEQRSSTRRSSDPAEPNDRLEFPDWDEMDDSPSRITPEAAFRLSENYPALGVADRSDRVDVEFIL
jgi:hypothetical protein